jgi:chromosome segregation ATPase
VIIVLVLLGVALAISLAVNLGLIGGQKPTAQASSNTSSTVKTEVRTDDERARKAEAELDKKTKELGEVKKSLSDLKDELKNAKKKLFEQKEGEKAGDDLVKARAEVERQASIQLDATRAELAAALADIAKLKTEAENKGKKKLEAAPVEKKEEVNVEKPQEVVTRVIRELNDVEKERIAKLEAQSSADRKKANELDRELKSLRAKFERHNRDTKRVYADANLARDKFRAVEMRLNRTTMENDLLKRAIKDLEKKSGVDAGRLELTAEEISTGDSTMKAKHAAEDAAEADARAKLEAAPATHLEEAPAADAPAAPAPAAAEAAPTTPVAQA